MPMPMLTKNPIRESGMRIRPGFTIVELMAVIEGLSLLTKPSIVELYSDSQYVLKGLKEWLSSWKRRGWKTADKKPVKNVELWQRLDELASSHDVRMHWIRGHQGHPENERADRLAVKAREDLGASR